jgi:hypothetical protein
MNYVRYVIKEEFDHYKVQIFKIIKFLRQMGGIWSRIWSRIRIFPDPDPTGQKVPNATYWTYTTLLSSYLWSSKNSVEKLKY